MSKILNVGNEPEMYEHETEEILLDVIAKYIADHPNELRRVDVLTSVLEANKQRSTNAEKKRQRIKSALKGVSTMNASLKKDLQDLGCIVMDGKKHYKIRLNGDTRYQATMAKTGSDGNRGGNNLASEIIKIMFQDNNVDIIIGGGISE